jgi:hypothetical protein
MIDTPFRIIRISDPDPAEVERGLTTLPGQIVNGLLVQTLGIREPLHQEGGVWCLRVFVEGIVVAEGRAI